MSAGELFDVAGARLARPFSRAFPALLLLFGLIFMHGACGVAVASTASGGGAEGAWSATLEIEPAVAGPHHDHKPYHQHRHSDHAPCCHFSAGDECIALLVASFLFLLSLCLSGPAIRTGVSRGLLWARPKLRASPPGGTRRLVLCVIRI